MNIYSFQSTISTIIANKFKEYMENPLFRTRDEVVPFFYNLSAITGAGKTLILADSITQMRMQLPLEPIVLWISKGKVVVSQTYNNLSAGKYSEFVPGFSIIPLLDCKVENIESEDTALLLIATVGKFNRKDMNKGDRMVFRVNLDNADLSLWDMLKARKTSSGLKRSLFIVYDEGHNLSDQQTKLLLELNPEAIISASATMRIPEILHKRVMQRIMDDKGWKQSDFFITAKSSDVVDKGLIKKHIAFGGYVTPMEIAIDELVDDYNKLCEYNASNNIGFKPKAIYISNTNIIAETGAKDNHLLPFDERKSSPILIWKHLVKRCGIDPNDIAIYCDLKTDPHFPVPNSFHLFSGNENDYDRFITEDFHHIIFNLSLQEGWDDPQCYFAYIDKDMGSKDQITQVLGRVLRQPSSKHFPNVDLNTAHIYVRTDSKNAIDEVIKEIRQKLASETPEIHLTIYKGDSSEKNNCKVAPRKSKKLPLTTIEAEYAIEPIRFIVDSIPDFGSDQVNTVGNGARLKLMETIGSSNKPKDKDNEWVEVRHTNRITVRWLFKRELQKYFPKITNLCDTERALFDALVEYSSVAAGIIKAKAKEIVDTYIEYSVIIQDSANTFTVSDVYIDPQNAHAFSYSLHEKYSDFNPFELEFANELDRSKKTWFRNPKQGCFSIPLLDKGDTNNFNPDFIVWNNRKIIAIDTKGEHLIAKDAARKLFSLKKYGKGADLIIRLVTHGEWENEREQTKKDGYTVWEIKNGRVIGHYVLSLKDCVACCLL
ncbi:MAG: DEAD/DEAH box helicase family protein [Tannerellaceae bacterium]|jgi:type III restriction enzyme|nr:DEAD/DEAH box helicase family protein [Tannerellaceae bacterium]